MEFLNASWANLAEHIDVNEEAGEDTEIINNDATEAEIKSRMEQVSLTFNFNSVTFGISAVYASTCYIHRRTLWRDLINCHTQINIPWCTLGDFNAIIGAHEHRGFSPLTALPMAEFLEWSNNDNFIHLPIRGV